MAFSKNIPPNKFPIIFTTTLFLSFTSCSGIEYHSAEAAYASKCETESHAHWFVSPQPLKSLLLISKAYDPKSTDEIVPIETGNGTSSLQYVFRLLGITGARRIDVYIGHIGPSERELLGENAPLGDYAIEVKPLHSSDCYDLTRMVREPDTSIDGYPVRKGIDQTCLVWRYVGPLDVQGYQYVLVNSYDDQSVTGPVSRDVQSLRGGDGTIYAQSATYYARYSDAAAGLLCTHVTDIYTLMMNTKFGDVQ